MRRSILLLCLLVTGCLNPPKPVIEQQLSMLNGQPASAAIARLGHPTSEDTVAGRKVYVWSNSRTFVLPARGMTYGGMNELQAQCTLRVFVNKHDVIVAHDVTDNSDACAVYAHKLDSTYHF